MKTKKTTFEVEGCIEPCFEVSSDDGFVLVRIHPCYHLTGSNSLYVSEYLDGDFNSREEIRGDFEELDTFSAQELAEQMSVYLN